MKFAWLGLARSKSNRFSSKEINLAIQELEKRTKPLGISARSKLLEQYANPVIRKQQSH